MICTACGYNDGDNVGDESFVRVGSHPVQIIIENKKDDLIFKDYPMCACPCCGTVKINFKNK